jgi:hypothetical protein
MIRGFHCLDTTLLLLDPYRLLHFRDSEGRRSRRSSTRHPRKNLHNPCYNMYHVPKLAKRYQRPTGSLPHLDDGDLGLPYAVDQWYPKFKDVDRMIRHECLVERFLCQRHVIYIYYIPCARLPMIPSGQVKAPIEACQNHFCEGDEICACDDVLVFQPDVRVSLFEEVGLIAEGLSTCRDEQTMSCVLSSSTAITLRLLRSERRPTFPVL